MFFEEMSRIPHGSNNEKGISDYFVAFAKERDLWVHQDAALNVIMKKPGTKGHEFAPIVIIQAHMDMVCEKNEETVHDFLRDPLKLIIDGDFLRADGTTLGADNAIAIGMCLALLDSDNIPHPPLEVVFTTGEEIGLIGVSKLDGSLLDGRLLLNLDSGEEGVFTVTCAGGGYAHFTFCTEYDNLPSGYITQSLKVKGLKGGHSGVDITKERANSNIILARGLRALMKKHDIQFVDIKGGAKENAIPRESEVVIAFAADKQSGIAAEVENLAEMFQHEYSLSDDGLMFYTEATSSNHEKIFRKALCEKIVSALLLIPNGPYAMSLVFDGLTETSQNIGILGTKEKEVFIGAGLRSAVTSRHEMLADKNAVVAELTGAKLGISGIYPAWEYNANSALRKKAAEVYADIYGKEPIISGTHGGLECGILSDKLPGVDIISFGPDIHEMHTPNEHVSISSVKRVWEFLQKFVISLAA